MINGRIKFTKNIIIIISSILIILTVILFAILSRSYITLNISPSDSIVRINNAPVSINSSGQTKLKVKPGNTYITVEAEGYIGQNQTMELKAGKNYDISIILKKNPVAITDEIGLTQNSNISFISNADEENSIFYLSDNGTALYKAKFQVNDEEITLEYNQKISNPSLSGIKDIIWSPNKNAALFKKQDGVYFFDLKKYNLVSQEEVKYGEYIGDIAWSPNDSKIAYYYAPPSGEKSLIFANKTNTEMTRVANFLEMGIENPYLKWSPDSEWLIVIPRNKDISTNKIYLFNTYSRSFTIVNDSGNNVEAIFSKDNNDIFYTVYSPDPTNPVKTELNVMKANGDNKKNLDIKALIARLTVFNSNNNNIIISTYDTKKQRESLFAYDVNKKDFSGFKIFMPEKKYISEIIVSDSDDLVFYLSENMLYALSLKQTSYNKK